MLLGNASLYVGHGALSVRCETPSAWEAALGTAGMANAVGGLGRTKESSFWVVAAIHALRKNVSSVAFHLFR